MKASEEKMRVLERVRRLRVARERMSEAAMAVEMARLREVEQRQEVLRVVEAGRERDGRRALEVGDGEVWRLAVGLRGADARVRVRLTEARKEGVERGEEARGRVSVRRMEREQVEVLRREVEEQVRVEKEKGEQAESDDRFLSRRMWAEDVRLLREDGG